MLSAFDPAFGATSETNPTSPVYGGRMIAPDSIYLWTWDARPYPVFPAAVELWGDGPNYETGHWLTGRLGAAPLDALIATILHDAGIEDSESAELREVVDGYLIDRPMAPRAAIEPLALAYAFDAAEEDGRLRFRPRGGLPVAELSEDDLALPEDGAPARLVRAQETELPREVSLGFTDSGTEYRRSAVTSRRLVGGSARAAFADLAVVTNTAAAERRAEIWLQDLWAGRESAEFALPPRNLALAAGDVIGLTVAGRRRLLELREIVDTAQRRVRARAIDPDVFAGPLLTPRRRPPRQPLPVGPVHALALDLPTLTRGEPPILTRLAVFADPWPGQVAVWRSSDGLGYRLHATVPVPATVGETLDPLPRGPTSRWDLVNKVRVRLFGGALTSISDARLFEGGNGAALRRPDGAWEVLQFADAILVAEQTYEISRLLRGQAGSEWAMADPLPAGAGFVLLDEHAIPIARGLDALERPMQLRLVAADRDHGDGAAVAIDVVPQATALQPLAPVHVRGKRTGAGVEISWVRRARIDGDAWSKGDVPLGEEREAYEVDVLSGSTTIRTLASSTPSVLYPAAQEIADFGAPQASLSVQVYQMSATVGRGFAAEAVLML